ncbi:MAG: sigma-70 family RNA polymerase sigma factor [Lachnospiraceae bacterium]|nr:sigma-70 family RNA polymerase sigma factor [Lachnospiraceae bacterium]
MEFEKKLLSAIKKMKNGEEEGFNQVYSDTYNYVYFRARQIMRNEEDALDLLQVVYMEAFRSIQTLEDPESLFSWLGAITYRQGMKLFRKKTELLLDEEAQSFFDSLESADPDTMPERSAEQKEQQELLSSLIEELPEAQRATVVAFYYDNIRINDIAEVMDCSVGTVKSRLAYARKFLKKRLAEESSQKKHLKSGLLALSVPAIYYAVQHLSQETVLAAPKAQMLYSGICKGIGLTAGTIGAAAAAGGTAASAGATAAGTAASAGTGATAAGAAAASGAGVSSAAGAGTGASALATAAGTGASLSLTGTAAATTVAVGGAGIAGGVAAATGSGSVAVTAGTVTAAATGTAAGSAAAAGTAAAAAGSAAATTAAVAAGGSAVKGVAIAVAVAVAGTGTATAIHYNETVSGPKAKSVSEAGLVSGDEALVSEAATDYAPSDEDIVSENIVPEELPEIPEAAIGPELPVEETLPEEGKDIGEEVRPEKEKTVSDNKPEESEKEKSVSQNEKESVSHNTSRSKFRIRKAESKRLSEAVASFLFVMGGSSYDGSADNAMLESAYIIGKTNLNGVDGLSVSGNEVYIDSPHISEAYKEDDRVIITGGFLMGQNSPVYGRSSALYSFIISAGESSEKGDFGHLSIEKLVISQNKVLESGNPVESEKPVPREEKPDKKDEVREKTGQDSVSKNQADQETGNVPGNVHEIESMSGAIGDYAEEY